jgi:hypothetical protein
MKRCGVFLLAWVFAACGNGKSGVSSDLCGDHVREASEECDGTDLNNKTCQSLGFSGGTLACSPTCVFDVSGCTNSGASCTNGYQKCVGTVIQTCAGGTWVAGTDCSPNSCVASNNVASCSGTTSCTDGDTQCSGTTVQQCYSNAWYDYVHCGLSKATCTVSGGTAGCSATGWCSTDATVNTGTKTVCADSSGKENNGNYVVECYNGVQDYDYNCAALVDLDGDPQFGGVCYNYGGGYSDCLMQSGVQCADDAIDDHETPKGDILGCGSTTQPLSTMGCDLIDGCVSITNPCNSFSGGPVCLDTQYLVLYCSGFSSSLTQPTTMDCSHFASGGSGGTCDLTNNMCLSYSQGPCFYGKVECPSGDCSDTSGTDWGTCP